MTDTEQYLNAKLKPCARCGSPAHIAETAFIEYAYKIVCENCGASSTRKNTGTPATIMMGTAKKGTKRITPFEAIDKTIKDWNSKNKIGDTESQPEPPK